MSLLVKKEHSVAILTSNMLSLALRSVDKSHYWRQPLTNVANYVSCLLLREIRHIFKMTSLPTWSVKEINNRL